MTRPEHGRVIRTIRNATGQTYRRLSFTEAYDWDFAYKDMVRTGYNSTDAAQRAYDCLFATRSQRWN